MLGVILQVTNVTVTAFSFHFIIFVSRVISGWPCLSDYFSPPGGVQSIVMSMFICLFAVVFLAYPFTTRFTTVQSAVLHVVCLSVRL